MLEGIFGNASAEKVLLYLEQYEAFACFARRSAAFDDLTLNMAQLRSPSRRNRFREFMRRLDERAPR